MLAFLTKRDGKEIDVLKNNRLIGRIGKPGFYVKGVVYGFVVLSSNDLKEIARKTEEHLAEIEFQAKSQKQAKGGQGGH